MADRTDGPREATVLQGGRRKAYRPLPPEARRAALADGLAACDRGDWFLAHELLEPAWMGTDDLPERELYQGLIKVAAAHVHRIRGNAVGMRKNLVGARALLRAAVDGDADPAGLDLRGLLAAVDDRLDRLVRLVSPDARSVPPIRIPRLS